MSAIKRLIQQLTGYWVYRARYLPRGTDLCWDIERMCGSNALGLVLDVGANTGQFTRQIRRRFSSAFVHGFEPVAETHAVLSEAMTRDRMVECHKLALSSECGQKTIFVNPDRTESSLNFFYGDFKEESVAISTVDKFCREKEIDFVDLLKVDTEGSDLDVLRGAAGMLEREAIKLILVETELVESARHFVPLPELAAYLRTFGYDVIALYDQRNHWDGRLSLSFCNALFGSSVVIDSVRDAKSAKPAR